MAKVTNLHFDVAIIGRSGSARKTGNQKSGAASIRNGQKIAPAHPPNAVAAAAYRSGQKLYDEQAREHHDYNPREKLNDARDAAAYRSGSKLEGSGNRPIDFTRKEDVVYSKILAPEGSPDWVYDRQTLWNKVERTEKRKDARVARDVIAALPRDLSREQQIALVNEFVRENFTSQGMVADVNIHVKDASDGGENPHVHIMLTTRKVDGEGFHNRKEKSWDGEFKWYGKGKGDNVEQWRASFEKLSNQYLEDADSAQRVSLKSYKEQGIDKVPQKHLGYEAANLEKRGKHTRLGDDNREIEHRNGVHDAVAERLEWQKGLNNGNRPEPRFNTGLQRNDAQLGRNYLDHRNAFRRGLRDRVESPDVQSEFNPQALTEKQAHRATILRAFRGAAEVPLAAAAELVVRVDDWIIKGYEQFSDAGYDALETFMGWREPENRADFEPQADYNPRPLENWREEQALAIERDLQLQRERERDYER